MIIWQPVILTEFQIAKFTIKGQKIKLITFLKTAICSIFHFTKFL